MQRLSGAISTKSVLPPQNSMQLADARNDIGEVIPSSLSFISRAMQARCRAAVPFEHAIACFAPVSLDSFFFKLFNQRACCEKI